MARYYHGGFEGLDPNFASFDPGLLDQSIPVYEAAPIETLDRNYQTSEIARVDKTNVFCMGPHAGGSSARGGPAARGGSGSFRFRRSAPHLQLDQISEPSVLRLLRRLSNFETTRSTRKAYQARDLRLQAFWMQ